MTAAYLSKFHLYFLLSVQYCCGPLTRLSSASPAVDTNKKFYIWNRKLANDFVLPTCFPIYNITDIL